MPKYELRFLFDADANTFTFLDSQPVDAPPAPDPAPVPTPEPTPDPVPAPAPDPGPAPDPDQAPEGDALLHPLAMRLGAQPWQADWGGSNPMVGTSGELDQRFLDDYAAMGFTVLRGMDLVPVNRSQVVSWDQRVLPAAKQSSPGVAYEYQIDMCNRGSMDFWTCVPLLADDGYVAQLAQLIKARLRPSLRVFVELSNEVWNGAFSALNQSVQLGQKFGLPGNNKWYQGGAYEVWRSLQVFDLFRQVFGAASMGTRVVRVHCEGGDLAITSDALANVYQSSKWNPSGQRLDMLAVAPYVGNGVDGAQETLARWRSEVDKLMTTDKVAVAKRQAAQHGIPLVGAYEGGMHHLQNAQAFASSALAGECYAYLLDAMGRELTGPACLYTSHGVWKSGGAWGLLQRVGDPVGGSPKAAAVVKWQRDRGAL